MAANRFATLIHRKTNRITLVLVYAFLEWTLISFILLNSLFSYFILRFADYFGLKRPCLLCCRLDRFFDPSGKSPSHRDLLCGDHVHALEISTVPSKPLSESKGSDESFVVFPEELVSCAPIEPDLRDDKGYSFTANLIGDDVQVHNGRLFTERSRSIFVLEEHVGSKHLIDSQERNEQETEEKVVDEEEEEETEEKVIDEEETEEKIVDDDDEFSCFVSSFDCNREVIVTEKEEEEEEENRVDLATEDKPAPATNLEFYIDDQDCHLIPVEEFYKPSEEVREISDVNGDFILDFGAEPDFTAAAAEEDVRLSSDEISALSKHEEAETNQGDLLMSVCPDQQQQPEPDFSAAAAAAGEVEDVGLSSTFPSPGESEPENAETTQGDLLMFVCPDQQQQSEPDFAATAAATAEEDVGLSSDEAVPLPGESKQDEAETKQDSPTDDESLQTQTDDEETDADVSIGTEIPDHEQVGDDQSRQLIIPQDNNDDDDNDHGNDTLEFRTVDIETRRPVLHANKERLLETSNCLHNAMFQLDRTEPEPNLEGSLTVAKLKSELEEERKALNALYEELEEERSASATAANETMAMINRLHEEKAAMQMEALQYQRMMEEQSEFDQEALQLLNEVIVKREKEIAELEKELEVCRKRLEEYEAKERMGMMMRRMRDSSVDSYRNNEGSDENNGEFGHKSVEGESEMENTPVDVVLRLDECLDDYEGERLSILGRLKFLEEKLTALNDEEDDEEEAKTFESNGSINGNGHVHEKETNGKHRVLKSKRLLPLFDAVDGEIGNGDHYENGVDESEKGEIVNVEEEVDELYERLEALEADREFLRHCVGSLKKGDKGVHLLHEILQHLRDLKNIDLIRVRENEDMSY
ncbi:myosin-binding protein 2 isoform X1 [Brassica rapa]|uniref:GTD-binding domain-containing protein n=1 Tax=Brassica campestris TaxID=3711 RepID=M4DI63_BRACM|nr:myosin-binding protein 2 isoform X1 [Brassica rapa]XP_033130201.1 myosin-binding protein 2 isoform X1 [Brassica rapa]